MTSTALAVLRFTKHFSGEPTLVIDRTSSSGSALVDVAAAIDHQMVQHTSVHFIVSAWMEEKRMESSQKTEATRQPQPANKRKMKAV